MQDSSEITMSVMLDQRSCHIPFEVAASSDFVHRTSDVSRQACHWKCRHTTNWSFMASRAAASKRLLHWTCLDQDSRFGFEKGCQTHKLLWECVWLTHWNVRSWNMLVSCAQHLALALEGIEQCLNCIDMHSFMMHVTSQEEVRDFVTPFIFLLVFHHPQ